MPAAANRLNDLSGKDWIKFTKSWFILPRGGNDRAKQALHPATFPLDLAKDFLQFFTKPSETVLDPFVGAGTTLEAADQLSRQAIGIELETTFAQFAASRSTSPLILGDALEVSRNRELLPAESVDYILTSPPYWNTLHKSRGGNTDTRHKRRRAQGQAVVYGNSPQDLGNIADASEYIAKLVDLFSDLHPVLRNRGYLTVILQNINDQGSLTPIAWLLGLALAETGLWDLKGEKIWCNDTARLGIYGYPTAYATNNRHHYCLTFRKV